MRLLFICNEAHPSRPVGGGIGTYVSLIAPALADRGHEVHVLSWISGAPDEDIVQDSVAYHLRGRHWLRGLGVLGRVGRLGWFANRLQAGVSVFMEYRRLGVAFDAVEYADWGAEGWFIARAGSLPRVVHFHTPLEILAPHHGWKRNLDLRLSCWLERYSARRAHVATAPSALVAERLEHLDWMPRNDVTVVPYPIDHSAWHGVEDVVGTGPLFLFVGRMEQLKAPEVLVEAVRALHTEVPEVEAAFVGRSNGTRDGLGYADWVRRLAGDDPRLRFLGPLPRTELRRQMGLARAFVLPARWDNYSLSVLEAMSAGRPVIVTDASGTAGFVGRHQTGKVVPAGDVPALADAMRVFATDPRAAAEAGENGRTAVHREHHPPRVAERREEIFEAAIEAFRGRLLKRSRGFPYAAPRKDRSLDLNPTWKDWVSLRTALSPGNHFYLSTGVALYSLLERHPALAGRSTLEGVSVLDFGSTPAVSVLLACCGADVVLLDHAEAELRKAVQFAEELDVAQRIHLLRADAFSPPLQRGRFDVVWNSGFIEHFDDPVDILRTMRSLARPGGAVVALVPNLWTLHTAVVRPLIRLRSRGYEWDQMGRERSYTRRGLVRLFREADLRVHAAETGNLARAVLDDTIFGAMKRRWPARGVVLSALNQLDRLESSVPGLGALGFMVGAIGSADGPEPS